jgi:GNAT superfamily N-acetyltransferase
MARSEPRMQPSVRAEAAGAPQIETLAVGNVADALALSDAAGWNQVGADWALFIEHGRTLGCRDGEGRLIATAAALPYGSAAGWVSMVLVAEAWRHRGLASALVRECLARLQASGALPLLDATAAGAAVYRGLGFAEGFAFDRWQSDAVSPTMSASARDDATAGIVHAATLADLDRIAALDAAASGLERRFLFDRLLARSDTRAWLLADEQGFVMARRGRRATHIGPLVAENARQAMALLGAALAASSRPTYVDVPAARQETVDWLEQRGFRRQRSFVRMSLGAAFPPEIDERSFVLVGPEFG